MKSTPLLAIVIIASLMLSSIPEGTLSPDEAKLVEVGSLVLGVAATVVLLIMSIGIDDAVQDIAELRARVSLLKDDLAAGESRRSKDRPTEPDDVTDRLIRRHF